MSHIHEKIDFCVEVFIVHKGRVLLRKHEKYGIWLSVGGHVELDEDPVEAAKREVKEEVGLDVEIYAGHQKFTDPDGNYVDLIPPVALGRHRVNETHEHVVFVYFATSDTDTVIPEKPTDEWKWATRDEFDALELRKNVRDYAAAALETLS